MRFATLLMLAAGAAFLTGCAPAVSIHPLYTSQDLTTDLPLEGTWADQDGQIWQVQKSGDGYQVMVLHGGDSPSTEDFNAHLLRLKGNDFLDVTSKSDPGLGIPGHVFAKIWPQGDELCVALLDDDWLKKTVQSGLAPQSVAAEGTGQIILTAPTSDLQRFMLLYVDVAEAWDADVGRFHRVN